MKLSCQLSVASCQKRGFSLIEFIMTITVLGLVLIPLGVMSIEFTRGLVYSRNLGAPEGLTKIEMAKVNNLAYDNLTLADGYDNTTVNYEGYPYDLRRTVNYVSGSGNLLKNVQLRVYLAGKTTNPLVNAITYKADVSFGAGSAGGTPGYAQANALEVSGGSIVGKQLKDVTLANVDPTASITITGMTITFTGAAGSVTKVTIGGTVKWSGSASSPATIILSSPFDLFSNFTYTLLIDFDKHPSSVTLVFVMAGGSQTVSYSW